MAACGGWVECPSIPCDGTYLIFSLIKPNQPNVKTEIVIDPNSIQNENPTFRRTVK